MAQPLGPRRLYLSKNRRKFLDAVREHGTIRAGAEAARMTRGEVLGLIEAIPGFRQAYELALADFRDAMEERALRMADQGDASSLRFRLRAEFPQKYGLQPARPLASPIPSRGQKARPGLAGGPGVGGSSGQDLDPAVVWDMFERLAAQREAAMKCGSLPAAPPA